MWIFSAWPLRLGSYHAQLSFELDKFQDLHHEEQTLDLYQQKTVQRSFAGDILATVKTHQVNLSAFEWN